MDCSLAEKSQICASLSFLFSLFFFFFFFFNALVVSDHRSYPAILACKEKATTTSTNAKGKVLEKVVTKELRPN